MKELRTLLYKEFLLEWRQKYALNGLFLYIVGAVMIAYLSFNLNQSKISPITWNAILWIIILFTAINAVSKSFMMERSDRLTYYYTIASPWSIILSKIIYNVFLMLVITFVGLGAYSLFLGNPVQDSFLFGLNLLMGAIGFSVSLTMVSAIAAKANNNATLMAIMSFPIIVPMLLLLIKVSKNAMDGLERSVSFDELMTLGAMNVIVIVVSLLLFPFLWKS